MALCWKYMVPLSFICLLGTICWMLAFPKGNQIFSVAMFVLGLLIVAYFSSAWSFKSAMRDRSFILNRIFNFCSRTYERCELR